MISKMYRIRHVILASFWAIRQISEMFFPHPFSLKLNSCNCQEVSFITPSVSSEQKKWVVLKEYDIYIIYIYKYKGLYDPVVFWGYIFASLNCVINQPGFHGCLKRHQGFITVEIPGYIP